MSEITKVTNKEDMPEVRVMKRAQKRKMRQDGMDLTAIQGSSDMAQGMNKLDDFVDYVLENVYPDYCFDSAENPWCLDLAMETYQESHVSEVLAKNLEMSGYGNVNEQTIVQPA